MGSRVSVLRKNVVYNLLGQSLVLLLTFAAVKFVYQDLGEDLLGIIYFASLMSAITASVLDMGIAGTTVREVAKYINKNNSYVTDLIKTASTFYWVGYFFAASILFILIPFIVENWISVTTTDISVVKDIVSILGVSGLLVLPRALYISLLRGCQKMGVINVIDVMVVALQQIGIVLILWVDGDAYNIAFWYTASYLLSVMVYMIVVGHTFGVSALVPGFSIDVVKKNMRFSANLMSISITSMIHVQSDKVFISKFLPIGMMGFYSIVYAVASKATMITVAISQASYPRLSELARNESHEELNKLYFKLQDVVCILLPPIFALIVFIERPGMELLFDKNVAEMLFIPTILLCLGFYMNDTVSMPYIYSLAVGKPNIVAKVNAYSLFVVIPAAYILISKYALVGAALSWVFYHVVYYLLAMPKICRECMRIPVTGWYLYIARILLAIIGTYGVTWYVMEKYGLHSLGAILILFVISTISYMLLAYLLIGDELKKSITHTLADLRGRIFSKGSVC